MSWLAFQPSARTEKLSRPSLIPGLRAAGEEAARAGAPGNTASPAAAATVDCRKARREVWERIDFIVRTWSSRFPLTLPTGMTMTTMTRSTRSTRSNAQRGLPEDGQRRPAVRFQPGNFAPTFFLNRAWDRLPFTAARSFAEHCH